MNGAWLYLSIHEWLIFIVCMPKTAKIGQVGIYMNGHPGDSKLSCIHPSVGGHFKKKKVHLIIPKRAPAELPGSQKTEDQK